MHSAASPDNDRQRPEMLILPKILADALPRILPDSDVRALHNSAKDWDPGVQS
jgi:hypothetical protein